MNYLERKREIIDILNSNNGLCSLNSLCNRLYVSRSTLRRDLLQLEEEGLINRHHGSISIVTNSATENSLTMRRLENPEKKLGIAKLAGQHLHNNMVIFLDSSSTVSYLAPILKTFKNITIITNGINIAGQINTSDNIKCYICPGIIKQKSLSVVGEYAVEFLNNFRGEAVFFSCKSISIHGIFEGDDLQALNKKHMLKNSDKKILLCDNTKEFSKGYFKLADFSDIDLIITNSLFSDDLMKVIISSGCQIICSE